MKIKEINLFTFFAYAVSSNQISFMNAEQAEIADREYSLGHSGEREVSILLENLIAKYGEEEGLKKAYDIVLQKYGDKWNRLFDAFVTKTYDPIENYSANEEENFKTKVKNTTTTKGNVYGFNSENPVPQNESEISNVSEGTPEDNERTLRRHGNIGVTTSQQMLQSEIDLRKWNYYDNLYIDMDRVLTSAYYN